MKQTNTMARLVWALALGCLPAMAQVADLDLSLKVRVGTTAGTIARTNDNHTVYGLGVMGSLPWMGGSLDVELAYDAFSGRRKDNTKVGGPVYYNPASPTTTYNGQTLFLSPKSSLDTRKHGFQGFGVRAGYSAPFALLEGWRWQAGVSLDRYKTNYEVLMTLVPVYGTGTGTAVPPAPGTTAQYYEGLAQTRTSTKLTPGTYIGLRRTLADNFTFDVNLRTVGFSQVDYAPFTYTGKPAAYSESTKFGYAIEVGFGLKL